MNILLFRQANKSVFCDVCPYHYIIKQNSASRGKLSVYMIYDPIKVRKRIIELVPYSLKEKAKAVYLSTCVNIYNTLICVKNLKQDELIVRQYIIGSKSWKKLTNKKMRFMIFLILRFNVLYKPFYRFYSKHLQKSKYL